MRLGCCAALELYRAGSGVILMKNGRCLMCFATLVVSINCSINRRWAEQVRCFPSKDQVNMALKTLTFLYIGGASSTAQLFSCQSEDGGAGRNRNRIVDLQDDCIAEGRTGRTLLLIFSSHSQFFLGHPLAKLRSAFDSWYLALNDLMLHSSCGRRWRKPRNICFSQSCSALELLSERWRGFLGWRGCLQHCCGICCYDSALPRPWDAAWCSFHYWAFHPVSLWFITFSKSVMIARYPKTGEPQDCWFKSYYFVFFGFPWVASPPGWPHAATASWRGMIRGFLRAQWGGGRSQHVR